MQIDYLALAPEIIVFAAACAVLMIDLVLNERTRMLTGVVAFGAVVLSLVTLLANLGRTPVISVGDLFVLDGFALVVKALMLGAGAFVILVSLPPMRMHRYEGEYYFFVLCSILGAMLMPSSRDLLMLFVALELLTAPAFIIAGLRKRNPRSNEATLKFFIIGVLSVGILVYGISLVYGTVGATDLSEIATRLAQMSPEARTEPLLLIGVIFIVGAFGFKVAAVPFHFWAPDTYEGVPTPLAAFLSVASKAGGFVGLMLILLVGFRELAPSWTPLVAGISVATMTLGNVMALRQRQLIRLLAYSSIAHAGYMLIPVAIITAQDGDVLSPSNAEAVRALVTYLVVYAVMNLGAFAVAIGVSKQYPMLLLRDLSGLARRAPLAAGALAAFLISLGGIPPFAGWFAKFAIFTAAVNVGSGMGVFLAAAMVINSVVSLFYYVGVSRVMFLQDPEEQGSVRLPPVVAVAVAGCLIGVVVLGVYPEPFARVADAARLVLFGVG